ncbi:hypothetical protein Moror_9516 [Moniliophthora roreri MCA 2997]|uniref:Uncharacterized protein n=2 Tax=Moniliophthora roreri TaxID=221103 RepID=V2WJJ5_MONRO|nr:hypothetical protein Moror_9516 [Moniliophthora roreri MCA 2997]KAI3615014.1 hypothetical protein WG66_016750 [Moniliophthora roreri]
MSREVMAYLGPKAGKMYRTVIAATLESGLFYSVYLGVLVIFEIATRQSKLGGLDYMRAVFLRLWAPVAGIASTIVIVRVALGISLDDTKSTIMTMQAAAIIDEPATVIDISRRVPIPRDGPENRMADRDTLNPDVEAQ